MNTLLAHRALACRSTTLSLHPLAPVRAAFSTSLILRQNTSAAATTAQNVQRTEQATTLSQPTPVPSRQRGAKRKHQRAAPAEPTLEEQIEHLDRIHEMEHTVPFDVWARPVRLFDIHVPTTMSTRKGASLRDHASAIFANMKNGLRNTFSLYRMAREQSFPDAKVKRTWSLDLFKVQSTPWLKPFTRVALDTYKHVNQAFAAGDEKTVKRLTISNYEEDLRRRLRSQNANYVYVWKFHGESKPAKVVSIRAEEVNLSSSPVTYGNRLLIQACVKFETTQSLEVYTKRGERVAGDGTPKPVVEYLVFQKRMWYDTPWVIRDQLFEGLQGRYTTTF